VTHHRYAVDGWGVGEVWVEDGVLLLHELAGTVPGLSVETRHLTSARAAEPDASGHGRSRGSTTLTPMGGGRAPTGTLPAEPSREENGFVPDLCRRFAEHLGGVPTRYDDVSVDESVFTPFQRELLLALRAVPWGDVVSYGELAALAGRPGAARAAGTFCAENQLSLVVPCHRVVAGNGIGGYGPSGVSLKRRLLALEGVEL
jgi:O-6-methylguanine DNA methyltransferase